jgi:hypothetical protein
MFPRSILIASFSGIVDKMRISKSYSNSLEDPNWFALFGHDTLEDTVYMITSCGIHTQDPTRVRFLPEKCLTVGLLHYGFCIFVERMVYSNTETDSSEAKSY